MTNTEGDSPILKTDGLGRVRTPAQRREELLDEFERSGTSGARFAALTGLKYQTFATWVQRRRRQRGSAAKGHGPKEAASTVRWLEAVFKKADGSPGGDAAALPVQLPGGARLEITCANQIPLAVALLRALEKAAASC